VTYQSIENIKTMNFEFIYNIVDITNVPHVHSLYFIIKSSTNKANILIEFWGDILQRFNKVNKELQKVSIDLETVISM